jgi:hypothetical protein
MGTPRQEVHVTTAADRLAELRGSRVLMEEGDVGAGVTFYIVRLTEGGGVQLLYSGEFQGPRDPGTQLFPIIFHGETRQVPRAANALGIDLATPPINICLKSLNTSGGAIRVIDQRRDAARAAHPAP